VTILANPTSIVQGSSSTLTVVATNATLVTVTGTDGSSYSLAASGGTQLVSRDHHVHSGRNWTRGERVGICHGSSDVDRQQSTHQPRHLHAAREPYVR
jgi:hypothetical protein